MAACVLLAIGRVCASLPALTRAKVSDFLVSPFQGLDRPKDLVWN